MEMGERVLGNDGHSHSHGHDHEHEHDHDHTHWSSVVPSQQQGGGPSSSSVPPEVIWQPSGECLMGAGVGGVGIVGVGVGGPLSMGIPPGEGPLFPYSLNDFRYNTAATHQTHPHQEVGNHEVLDEISDDCSEDDDDDEEEDVEESGEDVEDNLTYMNSHQQLSVSHLPIVSDDGGLPSCQQQRPAIPTMGIDDEIPPIPQQAHPLNSNPISAIPMITGDHDHMMIENDGDQNEQLQQSNISVHGKMYVEERVTFHLKQWTDSGFGNFNSCREQGQKIMSSYNRCAVCQVLRSPHDTIPTMPPKEHRHSVRGVIISFEDCIVLDLYPDQLIAMGNGNSMSEVSKQTDVEPLQVQVGVDGSNKEEMANFFTQQIPPHLISHPHHPLIEKEGPPILVGGHHEDNSGNHNWWNPYGEEEQTEEPHPSTSTSSNIAINLKLNAQRFHDSQQDDEEEQQEESQQIIEEMTENQDFTENNISPPTPLEKDYLEENENSTNPEIIAEEQEETSGKNEIGIPEINEEESEKIPIKSKKTLTTNKYPCPSCTKSFNLKRQLKHHLEDAHSSSNPFQCGLCKFQYTDLQRLQKHSCTLSVESLKIRSKMKEEKEREKKEQEDEEEEKVENLDFPKSSKVRKFAEKRRRKVEQQQQQESSSDSQSQSSSSENSKILSHPKKNKRKGENAENLPCSSTAGKQNKSSASAANIIRENHDENLTKENNSEGEEKEGKPQQFRCTICDKLFSQYRRFLNHQSIHAPERENQCEKCGKRFQRRDKLLRHMFVHEEKMFSCSICEKRFSRRDKLADHQKSHQTEEKHDCPMCERQFLRPDILKQHIKMHKSKEKHQCPQCLRFVTGEERLIQHMKRHEEAKATGQTLLCPLCTKYFIQAQSLKAHVRKFHPEELGNIEFHNLVPTDKKGSRSNSPNSDCSEEMEREEESCPTEEIKKKEEVPSKKPKQKKGTSKKDPKIPKPETVSCKKKKVCKKKEESSTIESANNDQQLPSCSTLTTTSGATASDLNVNTFNNPFHQQHQLGNLNYTHLALNMTAGRGLSQGFLPSTSSGDILYPHGLSPLSTVTAVSLPTQNLVGVGTPSYILTYPTPGTPTITVPYHQQEQ